MCVVRPSCERQPGIRPVRNGSALNMAPRGIHMTRNVCWQRNMCELRAVNNEKNYNLHETICDKRMVVWWSGAVLIKYNFMITICVKQNVINWTYSLADSIIV